MRKHLISVLLTVTVFAFTVPYMVSGAEDETFLRLPVRVLAGDNVVEDLGKDDFDLRIDGQKKEIAHCIKINRSLARGNAPRNFVLAFNITNYHGQQVAGGISYFVDNILRPGDSLLLWTPIKIYAISTDKDKKTITGSIQKILEEDTLNYKKNIFHPIATLKEIIKKYHAEVRDSDQKGSTSRRTASQFFLSNYSRELKNFKDRHILPNLLKTREVCQLLAQRNGQKWIINFQEREIIPNLILYQEVAAEILDMATKLSGNDMSNATRMYRVLDVIEKTMLISDSLPMKKITDTLQDANISYNAILFKAPDKRTSMGDSVAADVDKTFMHFARFSGGAAVVNSNLPKSLDIIRNHNDVYYDLVFKIDDRSQEKNIAIDLTRNSRANVYYKRLFTKKNIASLFAPLDDPGLKLDGFALNGHQLKFSISGYRLGDPGNKNEGLVKIQVNLVDEKNTVVYKTRKTLKTREKAIDFSLLLPSKYKGNFAVSINAVDLTTLKSIQLNRHEKF